MNKKILLMGFQAVELCPACGSTYKEILGQIDREYYIAENIVIPYQESIGVILVYRCSSCGLFFKNFVPTKNSLLDFYKDCMSTHWISSYDYNDEIRTIKKLFPHGNLNVLDIGAGNGSWLSCLSLINCRLSALDVIMNPNCKQFITGEYIIEFLDKKDLAWSGQAYDLVTVFDVVEHLYDVKQGFSNIFKLTRIGGYCIIETGDANNYYSKLYGVPKWWYLNILEHNIAFNLQSLIKAGESAGFEVVETKIKRHKNKTELSLAKLIRMSLLSSLYRIYPSRYKWSMGLIKKAGIQPVPPFSKDHLMVIFRRVC